jgi:diacylglycerol kinase (ATP)
MALNFFSGRIRAFKYAAKGAWLLLRKEPSVQAQAAIAFILVLAGFYFNISTIEWIAQILAIGLVLSIEGLNSAVEELADFVHPDRHKRIGHLKDIAAGAVLFAAVAAVVVGCLIYIPKF